jgi:branched-chain amino acid transport system ATP-binding protein
LARTFQSIELFDDLTVHENLVVAALERRRWSAIADAIAPRRGVRAADVDDVLDRVGLAPLRHLRPAQLSHGQRRLVSVGRALAAKPKLVLMDEPAAGLDPDETEALGVLVRRLPQLDIGVLLVDHDMTFVLGLCDELTVLDVGRVIASGPTQAVRDDPSVVDAYLGAPS